MRTIEKHLIVLYLVVCPVEIALHLLMTSSVKYIGLGIILIEACIVLSHEGALINFPAASISTLLWMIYCTSTIAWVDSNELTSEYITTYILMGTFLIMCTLETWNANEIWLFTKAYLVGSILMAFTVIFFGSGGGQYTDRETIVVMGKACDPNQVAANIVPGALIAFNLFLGNEKKSMLVRMLGLTGTGFCIYTIILTGSRGGFAALVVGMTISVITMMSKGKLKIGVVLVAVIIGFIAFRYIPGFQGGRALDVGSYNEKYSNQLNRVLIWKKLLVTFDTSWILGHGVGSTVDYLRGIIGKTMAVHNTFLLVLYEVGIVGFALFIFPYVSLAVMNIRRNVTLVSVMLGAVICSVFLDALNLRYLWNGLMLCLMQYNYDSYCAVEENHESVQAQQVRQMKSRYIKSF